MRGGGSQPAGALEGVGDLADGEGVGVGVGDGDVAVEEGRVAAQALDGHAREGGFRLGNLRDLARHELLRPTHQARHDCSARSFLPLVHSLLTTTPHEPGMKRRKKRGSPATGSVRRTSSAVAYAGRGNVCNVA
ncbi:hypothetical protein B296_00047351, partial [Ensete ventricosum]